MAATLRIAGKTTPEDGPEPTGSKGSRRTNLTCGPTTRSGSKSSDGLLSGWFYEGLSLVNLDAWSFHASLTLVKARGAPLSNVVQMDGNDARGLICGTNDEYNYTTSLKGYNYVYGIDDWKGLADGIGR